MKNIYLVGIIISIISFQSCNSDDLKADVPAYISIDDIKLKTTPSQGSNTDRIIDAKIFINDQSIGTYELPASVPVRTTGPVTIKIRSGIYVNGLSFKREDYPFFTTYEIDTVLIPETEIKLSPTIEYFSTAIFDHPYSGEDFESGVNFEYNPISDTTFERVSGVDAFEGNSGLAYLSENQTFFEARTPNLVDVPKNGGAVYMEFDYKSTEDIVVSLYYNGQSVQVPIIFLRDRSTYGKIYLNLAPVFSSYPNAINFNIAFGMVSAIGEVSTFHIDNVKFIRF